MKTYLKQLLYLLFLLLVTFALLACSHSSATVVATNQGADNEVAPIATVANQIEQPTISPSPTHPLDIIGTIMDGRTGNPLPSAEIFLSNGPGTSPSSLIADQNGVFQIQNIELPLTIRVESPGYELWETTLASLKSLVHNSPYKLEVNLNPQVTRGTVLAADTTEPLAGVTLTMNSPNGSQSVTTDSSGNFELYGLLPDTTISVEVPEGYLPFEMAFGGESELTLSLQPRQVIVTVTDGFSGAPVEGSTLAFNQIVTATTNTQGQATFSRMPRSGQFVVTDTPGYVSTTLDYQDSESVHVTLTPSGVQGVVRGSDTGQPLAQATIFLGDNAFRTDDNGRFVLESLPAEPTQLMIKTAGYRRTYAQLSQSGIFTAATSEEITLPATEGRWLTTAPCLETTEVVTTSVTTSTLPCLDITLEPFQAKAIYVPLHYLRSRERMIGYLDFIAATELNAIVVDVKGDFGFIAWDSQVELVPEIGADEWFTDTWMPLDEFIAEAKARNIYTIARMVVFKDNPLANGKPEWAAVREDGTVWLDGEDLGWANPFRQEVWDYNIALAKEVAAFGFDELNFDYIRFPSDGDVGAIVYEEENTLETRTAAIGEFMTQLSEALQPYGVFMSADVFGLTLWVRPDSDMHIGQRVIDIVPHIDYLAPMVYPSTFIPGNLGYDNPSAEPYGIVYRSQEQAETLVPPFVKVRPWLQGYWYTLDEMRLLKQGATDAQSTGWSWWNAGGKYDIDLFETAEGQNGE